MGYANRHQVEEYLAELPRAGCIVEVGGGYGNGAIALYHGTQRGGKLPIYVIDPYLPYRDLLGGTYGPETQLEFERNTRDAGVEVVHVPLGAEDAARTWAEPVSLLWLDLTMNHAQLKAIFDAWRPHLMADSYVGITGNEYGQLGTRELGRDLQELGYEPIIVDQDFVLCFHKTGNSRAVFYIVSADDGGRYVREAQRSAKSVREHLKIPTHLFLSGRCTESTEMFNYVHRLPDRRERFWYLDSTRFFNHAVQQLTEYDQLLYLDVDTYICCPCLDLFRVLDNFDLAMGQSPQRDAIASVVGAPPAFSTLSIGVNVFRNTQRVRDFLAGWLERYERHADFYDDNDQAPLRDALYEDRSLHWMTLPPEYNMRFDFGAWMVGRVRILHGRVGGISTDRVDPQPICDQINRTARMRIWDHGILPSNLADD